jgi:hypothetical protein
MSAIETGGPAFPMQEPQAIHAYAIAAVDGITDSEERDRAYLKGRAEAVGGATLRDYFAVRAMQSLLTTIDEFPDEHWRTGVATDAYSMADAMLAARKGGMQP